jgi:hypothetical protein
MVQPRQLIVIRRGEAELFGILHDRCVSGASPADVIWDRRIRDRRVIIRDDVSPERRRTERRATEPSTWTSHGFLITRAAPAPGDEDLRSRPRTRPPLAPGRTEALIDTAIRPDASACGHLGPRGLRTDADHVRLYARLIRQSSRPLPGQWPASRLRRGDRGFPA